MRVWMAPPFFFMTITRNRTLHRTSSGNGICARKRQGSPQMPVRRYRLLCSRHDDRTWRGNGICAHRAMPDRRWLPGRRPRHPGTAEGVNPHELFSARTDHAQKPLPRCAVPSRDRQRHLGRDPDKNAVVRRERQHTSAHGAERPPLAFAQKT